MSRSEQSPRSPLTMYRSARHIVALAVCLSACGPATRSSVGIAPSEARIRPSTELPRYWEYEGEPTALIGGSREDNLFQILDLEEHLDLLAEVDGNYMWRDGDEVQGGGPASLTPPTDGHWVALLTRP